MLRIKFRDILRATLRSDCGNEGWIGISPRGDAYHIVVPVDRQIAKGVMACNRPTDGTPFGGYYGWLYFPCSTYASWVDSADEASVKQLRAQQTAQEIIETLKTLDIEAELE